MATPNLSDLFSQASNKDLFGGLVGGAMEMWSGLKEKMGFRDQSNQGVMSGEEIKPQVPTSWKDLALQVGPLVAGPVLGVGLKGLNALKASGETEGLVNKLTASVNNAPKVWKHPEDPDNMYIKKWTNLQGEQSYHPYLWGEDLTLAPKSLKDSLNYIHGSINNTYNEAADKVQEYFQMKDDWLNGVEKPKSKDLFTHINGNTYQYKNNPAIKVSLGSDDKFHIFHEGEDQGAYWNLPKAFDMAAWTHNTNYPGDAVGYIDSIGESNIPSVVGNKLKPTSDPWQVVDTTSDNTPQTWGHAESGHIIDYNPESEIYDLYKSTGHSKPFGSYDTLEGAKQGSELLQKGFTPAENNKPALLSDVDLGDLNKPYHISDYQTSAEKALHFYQSQINLGNATPEQTFKSLQNKFAYPNGGPESLATPQQTKFARGVPPESLLKARGPIQKAAQVSETRDLNTIINARDSLYHTTTPDAFFQIMQDRQIKPGYAGDAFKGVSTSRVPTIAPKTLPITLVLDQKAVPSSKATADFGYQKTGGSYVNSESSMNRNFEHETRTLNKPIPTTAIKGIIVNKKVWNDEAFNNGDFVDQLLKINQTAQTHGIPVKVVEGTKELHTYRAKMSKLPPTSPLFTLPPIGAGVGLQYLNQRDKDQNVPIQ